MIERRVHAGAAAVAIDPPLGLPMMGVVARSEPARARTGTLEVTALAFDDGERRVVLCGVDTLAIQSPEIDEIRARVVAATGAELPGVLINFGHTHHAPAGGATLPGAFGEPALEPDAGTRAYVEALPERIVEACREACARLEPAAVRWGLGSADLSVNRRERDGDGRVRRLGWHEAGMLDQSVPVLQARRADESVIATLVGYGCHTVTTGVGRLAYSPDYPGPMREALRRFTGGEAVFFLGAAGNVMPRVSFADGGEATRELGELLAVAALHAVSGARPTWPAELVEEPGIASGSPVSAFRWHACEAPAPALAAIERRVAFPLQPAPSLAELIALRDASETQVAAAAAAGRPEVELRVIRFHGHGWTRRVEGEVRDGARTHVPGTVGAVRIGDGVIATGPGEIFTEIGLAVKERSPAAVTLYAGLTNGAVSYFPTASEYPLGGYEPAYANKTYGLPAQVDPACDRLLVETAVALIAELFPDAPMPSAPTGWLASGRLPAPPAWPPIRRPPPPAER